MHGDDGFHWFFGFGHWIYGAAIWLVILLFIVWLLINILKK
jgi:hypothetical protein